MEISNTPNNSLVLNSSVSSKLPSGHGSSNLSGATCRLVMSLNTDWRFTLKPSAPDASTTDWETIVLPHTWNALDGQDGPASVSDTRESKAVAHQIAASRQAAVPFPPDSTHRKPYYRGICWYQRSLEVPSSWNGKKRVFLRVGAASTVARTYVNQILLGEHRGGFTAFAYELTECLKYGMVNELRLQVDNSPREDLPPLAGDFNIFGGLYRGVELVVTNVVCVSPLDYASSGIYLTTLALDETQATVAVRTVLSNGLRPVDPAMLETSTPVTLETVISDAEGHSVAQSTDTFSVPLARTESVTQTLVLPNPHLWNGRKDPFLYTATVRVLADGRELDQVTQPLGLRTAYITQEQGFLLNGQPYPIHGVNRHQDKRNQGWALSRADEALDAALMLEMGVNAVRNAHYPQGESWHSIADREGLLVWDELSLVNEVRSTREFWANSEENLREMIHQLYNHPCIIWWGIFNELENSTLFVPPSGPEIARLHEVIKRIDPSRIAVGVSDRSPRYFNHITQEIGFNMYPGWYGRVDPSNPVDLLSIIADRCKAVGKRIAITEYGAGGNIAHHEEGVPSQPLPSPSIPFHPEEWQAIVHERDWAQIKASESQLWGTFIWAMFDFSVNSRDEGNIPCLNDKGLVTHDRRFGKDAYYFYKANWNPAPMVYLASRRATPRQSATAKFKCYSNCPMVELRVNHRLIGLATPDAMAIACWPSVTLEPGENLIELTGIGAAGTLAGDSCVILLQTPQSNS